MFRGMILVGWKMLKESSRRFVLCFIIIEVIILSF